jgi:hypothetical protein
MIRRGSQAAIGNMHEASVTVSAQLGVAVDHAMVRLRAFALAGDRPLVEVARRVVNRTLRFDPASETDI